MEHWTSSYTRKDRKRLEKQHPGDIAEYGLLCPVEPNKPDTCLSCYALELNWRKVEEDLASKGKQPCA